MAGHMEKKKKKKKKIDVTLNVTWTLLFHPFQSQFFRKK